MKSTLRERFKAALPGSWLDSFRRRRKELRNLKRFRHLGLKYRCPVCGRWLRCFLPLPEMYYDMFAKHGFVHSLEANETFNIKNYLCPICGAEDRTRLYALFLARAFQKLDRNRKYSLLDMAPSRPLARFLKRYRFLASRSADLMRNDVDDKVDIVDMKIYGDNSFDFFLCSHVLEHVVEHRKGIKELYRVLKPGGWGIVMSPILLTLERNYEDASKTTEAERWKHFMQGDHVRLYAKGHFVELLEEAGFVVHQYGIDYFGSKTFHKHGIAESSVLYVVSKATHPHAS